MKRSLISFTLLSLMAVFLNNCAYAECVLKDGRVEVMPGYQYARPNEEGELLFRVVNLDQGDCAPVIMEIIPQVDDDLYFTYEPELIAVKPNGHKAPIHLKYKVKANAKKGKKTVKIEAYLIGAEKPKAFSMGVVEVE